MGQSVKNICLAQRQGDFRIVIGVIHHQVFDLQTVQFLSKTFGSITDLVTPEKGISLFTLRSIPDRQQLLSGRFQHDVARSSRYSYLYTPSPDVVRILLRFWPIERGSQSSEESDQLLPLAYAGHCPKEVTTHKRPIFPVSQSDSCLVCVYDPVSPTPKSLQSVVRYRVRLRGRSMGASVACGMVIIQRRVGGVGVFSCMKGELVPSESKRKLASQSPDMPLSPSIW